MRRRKKELPAVDVDTHLSSNSRNLEGNNALLRAMLEQERKKARLPPRHTTSIDDDYNLRWRAILDDARLPLTPLSLCVSVGPVKSVSLFAEFQLFRTTVVRWARAHRQALA